MSIPDQQTFICQKAIERKVKWTRHALGKLAAEPISSNAVEIALQEAEIIEEYPHLHRYLPDCLVLAFISPNKPIHCVAGINKSQDYILIVTIYQPTVQEWQNDWRTRK
jgi:hypothetical protein